MEFVNRRIGALADVLSPKDAACALARRLRQHVQAHDAFTAALRIRAGRKQTFEIGVDRSDQNPTEEMDNDDDDDDDGGDARAAAGGGDEDVEEHDVQVSFLRDAFLFRRIL